MTLTIGALSLNDQPLSQPCVAHFDAAGGTIGRGEHNTLMLPDPQRHISRQHARISADGPGYRITNLSSANIVTVAGRGLAGGESAPIHHRDRLRIGGFLLEVIENSHALAAEEPAAIARTITARRAALSACMAGDTAIWQVPAPAPAMRPASRPPPRPEPSLAPDPALWQAFCDAAGVQVDLPQGLGPAEMRTLGQLLRAAVDGTMLLLAGRTLQQPAPGSDLTSTQAADNNPLDFAASGQDALELLLQPPLRGFMAAPDAMTRTMQQLVSHQTGQSAAWHAAVDGAFDPFAPAELQARHRPAMVIHTLLPMTHRSRLWSHYLADFDTLCHQARDRLQARYEQAYVAACYPGAERRPATDRPTNQGSVPPPHHDVSHPPPPSGRSAPAGDRTP